MIGQDVQSVCRWSSIDIGERGPLWAEVLGVYIGIDAAAIVAPREDRAAGRVPVYAYVTEKLVVQRWSASDVVDC